MRRLLLSILLALVTAFALVGCTSDNTDGNGSSSGAQTDVLELSADVYELTVGESFTLSITNKPSGETAFSSSNEAVATVSENGVVNGASEGVAVITVTVGSQSESCRVTVKKSPNADVLAFLGEEATLRVGGTEKALSVFHKGVKVTEGVVYSVENTSVATVDEKGRAKGLQKGETTVTATYNGFTATCKLIVKNIVSMQVTKNVVFLQPNESFEIRADVYTGAALTKLETPETVWSVRDSSVAKVTTDKNTVTVTGVAGGSTVLTVGYEEAIEEIYVSVARKVSDYESFKTLADTKYPYIVLDADIDVSGATWSGQGTAADGKPVHVIQTFSGILDGNGKKLYGLTKTTTDYVHNVGFFGRITTTATIKNVLFEGTLGYNADGTTVDAITARTGIFAWENAGTIKNCYIQGEIYTPWKYDTSGMYTLIGAVYRNNGTIESVVTDISVATAQHTAAQNARKFGFAAINHGTIKNSVTVSTAVRGTSYDWMSGDINDAVAGGALGTSVYWTAGGPSYQTTLNACVQKDAGRTDCYVFTTYANLLSGDGYGDKFNGDVFDNTTYAKVSSATAQEKLGAAWRFDTAKGTISLLSREIFRDLSIKHSGGVLTWTESGESTILLDGTEIAKTSAQSFDLFGYFKANAKNLSAGEKQVQIQTGNLQRKATFAFTKPTTLVQLQEAAANKDAYIYLTQDIDLSQATWTGDGTTAPGSAIPELHGVIEGNGYKLLGLRKVTETIPKHNVGFIGRIKSGARIENVIFTGSIGYKADGSTVSAIGARTGIFAWENAGTIKNCYIQGEIYTPWKYATSSMYSLIGAVYRNKGVIESVVTDISVQTSEWSAATNPRKFGFAVFNTGTIKNSVTISTAVRGDQHGWMSNDSDEAFALKDAIGEFGTINANGSTGNFGQSTINTSDAGRTDCYLFTTYTDLLSESGYGDNFNGDVFDNTTYAKVSATTAQEKLGAAWSFADGKIKLNGTVVYAAQ